MAPPRSTPNTASPLRALIIANMEPRHARPSSTRHPRIPHAISQLSYTGVTRGPSSESSPRQSTKLCS
uniref:Uncharacterized protein MANES_11G114700 n=1 Tax=Rhizophora mucronata TaxID=61149 RepID=A0A2P2Q5W7_RHIMU